MKSRPSLSIIALLLALSGLPVASTSAGVTERKDVEPDFDYEMATDRPDTTESPYTTKVGKWQFEIETLSVSLDDGNRSEDWGSANIKYGLSRHLDVQLVTPAWHSGDGADGWLDTELRLKWNLTGREGDGHLRPLAIALMPYVKLPSASHDLGNGDVEGGLIIPMALTSGAFAWMIQADVIRNEDDDGYTGAFTFSATKGLELGDRLSAFVEGVATLPLEGDAQTYLNAGLVFEMNRNWFLDAGVNIGLNRSTEDIRIFTGTSFRF